MKSTLQAVWAYLRRVTGDDAYECYLEHQRARHPDARPLTRREYFKRRQDEKWSKVSRCC
jgi:uncharacterized short protein YbdD (DUF466 family)